MNKKFKNGIGVIAGCFDIIHPGYIDMFKEAKNNCRYFIVLLQSDPTIDRPEKNKPVLSVDDRIKILESIKYIDDIIIYSTENELYKLLKEINPEIRFLGDDYKNKKINGEDLNIPIHYLNRNHGWSSTKFKELISNNLKKSYYIIKRMNCGTGNLNTNVMDSNIMGVTTNKKIAKSYENVFCGYEKVKIINNEKIE